MHVCFYATAASVIRWQVAIHLSICVCVHACVHLRIFQESALLYVNNAKIFEVLSLVKGTIKLISKRSRYMFRNPRELSHLFHPSVKQTDYFFILFLCFSCARILLFNI
jgi:hypothetical protein